MTAIMSGEWVSTRARKSGNLARMLWQLILRTLKRFIGFAACAVEFKSPPSEEATDSGFELREVFRVWGMAVGLQELQYQDLLLFWRARKMGKGMLRQI